MKTTLVPLLAAIILLSSCGASTYDIDVDCRKSVFNMFTDSEIEELSCVDGEEILFSFQLRCQKHTVQQIEEMTYVCTTLDNKNVRVRLHQ